MSTGNSQPELRIPSSDDGASVFRLISQCPPLDTNSMYCNLLQCTHFADTSVAAVQKSKSGEALIGFASGYIIPDHKDTLFIWQVAVSEQARGIGLAGKMLNHILDRSSCSQINYLETTITESNNASWALFESLSKKLGTTLERRRMFDREQHFSGEHDTELLARLGPLHP